MINFFIAAYILGYTVFFTQGEEGSIAWENAFFVWQQFGYGSVFAWAALYGNTKGEVRKKVMWVLIFSCLMAAWQIASIVCELNINNERAVTVAFGLIVILTSLLCLKEDKITGTWLRKHLKI